MYSRPRMQRKWMMSVCVFCLPVAAGSASGQQPPAWTVTHVVSASEAFQAAAADGEFYYAISSTQVAKYSRESDERVATSTGEAPGAAKSIWPISTTPRTEWATHPVFFCRIGPTVWRSTPNTTPPLSAWPRGGRRYMLCPCMRRFWAMVLIAANSGAKRIVPTTLTTGTITTLKIPTTAATTRFAAYS
jgi:hypothetical protein